MDCRKIIEAVEFAAIAHDGQYRKGTKIPYITHVVETGIIATTMTDNENVIIAAILHDVLEDTCSEPYEISSKFNDEVLDLVMQESEDKMKDISSDASWKIRKEVFLDHLGKAPINAKIICLADKLSNMRLSVKTHAQKGDDMWLTFNQKDKSEQEWYYRSIYKKCSELKDTAAYKEYVDCCDKVFGRQGYMELSGSDSTDSGMVMYDPLIPEDMRMNGLVDFTTRELNKISDFFYDIYPSEKLTKPYVFLSDKILKHPPYGKLSDRDLIDKIKEYANTIKRTDFYEMFMEYFDSIIQNIEVDINSNKEHNTKESWSDLLLTMMGLERTVKLEGTAEDKEILKGLIHILSMRRVDDRLILGEYLPDRHQIIIYYRAIERESESFNNPRLHYDALLSSVIAHEYFHAMHHAMAPGHPIWNKSSFGNIKAYQKKEITEALADLFSVLWCNDRSEKEKNFEYEDVAIARFESWRKYLYSAWPYAKAIYLMQDVDGRLPVTLNDEAIKRGIIAINNLLELSILDIPRAYEYLRNK